MVGLILKKQCVMGICCIFGARNLVVLRKKFEIENINQRGWLYWYGAWREGTNPPGDRGKTMSAC